MTAPSIKEALEAVLACAQSTSPEMTAAYAMAEAALATFQPDGERREAIARIIEPHSNLFVDPTELASWNEALAKADLILASGLVQDEAGIRADEREKCAEIADLRYEPVATEIAAAIRFARNGGAS